MNYKELTDAAIAAQTRGDFPQAQAHWEAARQKSPNEVLPYCGVIGAAREYGQLAFAEKTLHASLERFPNNQHLVAEGARVYEKLGKWDKAFEYWSQVAERRDAPAQWRHSHAHALLVLGRFDEAERQLDELERLHPDYRYLLALRGMHAAFQQQWDKAVPIWRKFCDAYPDDPVGWEHYGRAHQAREMARLDEIFVHNDPAAANLSAPAQIEKVEQDDLRDLMLGFESIGRNCEFGLVQRRYNGEPLGLLRFSMVNVGSLITALRHRFAGLGDPAVTELKVMHSGEYFLQDKRWGIGTHTFLFRDQAEPEALFPKSCRRWVFLRDKLLSDLGEAKKVYVYYDEEPTLDDVHRLHRELKAIGNVVLLHVRPVSHPLAGAPAAPGAVTQIASNLFVGYLRRGGVTVQGTWDIAFEDWVAICSEVRRVIPMRTDAPPSVSAFAQERPAEAQPVAPGGLVAFDTYESRPPSAQNAIDAIPGWNSQFPAEYNLRAGNRMHFQDERMFWAIKKFGSINGAQVLELGPLEGAQTYVLDRAGAKITGVEANKLAYLKCLVTKEIVGLPNARFLLGDCVQYLEQNETRYDLIVACGVLYHMPDPLRFLSAVAARTDQVYIWTHFIDLDAAAPDDPAVVHYRRVCKTQEFRGAVATLYPRSYANAEKNDDFCGGIYDEPHWMSRQSILDVLRALGFTSIEVTHENTPSPLEPCFSVYARRQG